MNMPANAFAQSTLDPDRPEVAANSPLRVFYWCVRRELWESRSLYLGPLGIAGLYLLGFLFYLPAIPRTMRAAMAAEHGFNRDLIAQPFNYLSLAVMGIAFLISLLYSVETLYAERRDRSILFWKSMPVSDLTVVLSKASIPILFLPLLCFVITVVAQYLMLMLSSVVLLGANLSVATLWSELALFRTLLMLLYHLVTIHMLWYAPIYAYLLLVSAWARRVPLLWAILPPVAILILEKAFFHTSFFHHLIGWRFSGGPEAQMPDLTTGYPIHPAMHPTPLHFFATPSMWLGLLFAAACLLAAARLRRNREPV
ncbi:MAG TPA: ABC transporter permease [Candidatus Eisenbacteria bacterium]|nr:ABC transporter permease [Candidatus Eisenbacteria bacterium]